jgi:hypothetical protein
MAFAPLLLTDPNAAEAAEFNDVELLVVKRPEVKKGFVLLPQRWMVQHSSPGQPLSSLG